MCLKPAKFALSNGVKFFICYIGRYGHIAKWPFWELSPMLGLGLELEGKALFPYKASGAYIILPQIKRC